MSRRDARFAPTGRDWGVGDLAAWPRSDAWAVALALASGIGIYVLRNALANPNDGITLLFCAPITYLAIRFGAAAGIGAALVSVASFVVWETTSPDVHIGPIGYATRAGTFLIVASLVGTFAADRRRLVKELRVLASRDPLTGVLNHASFYREVEHALAMAQRHGRPSALLVADLDRFKEINDTYGHTAGDALLRRAAQAFGSELRETDALGRIGGDEFAVLLRETDREGAEVARGRRAAPA